MPEERWTTVDHYFTESLVAADPALDAALAASSAAGLPSIAVSPPQGKLLHLLAKLNSARAILEIGTLGGYSTIWLARALPADGKLVSLELSDHHANVARENLARAGVADKVQIIVGRAVESLAKLSGAFDLIFIDADKPSNPDYLTAALRLSRPGSLIIVDNVVFGGAIADGSSTSAAVQGTRRMIDMIRADPRLSATAIQVVGSKGYDGMLLARVEA